MWAKTKMLDTFWLLVASVPTAFYRWGPNLVCYSRPIIYAYLANFVSIGFCVVLWWRKTQILPFFYFGIYWCCQLAAVWESWTRLHNYKSSPIQRYQNRFCTPTSSWRNRAHNVWRSKAWRTNRHTDRQKTQRFWTPRRRAKSEPYQTWHGDRGPRARFCTSKPLVVWGTISPLGGAESLG